MQKRSPIRGIANIRQTGLPERLHDLVQEIVQGNLSYVSHSKTPKSWFNYAIDSSGNKLVAFAAKIALQKGVVNSLSTPNRPVYTPWGSIFLHLVVKSRDHDVPVFTQAAGSRNSPTRKNYTVLHVIADHAERARDVEALLNILVTHSGKNRAVISKEMKKRQGGAGSIYSPGAIANRRGVLPNGTHTGAFAPLFRRLKIPNKVNSHEYMGIMSKMTEQMEQLTLEKEEEKKKRRNAERRALNLEAKLKQTADRYKHSKAPKTTARAAPSQAGPSQAGPSLVNNYIKRTYNTRASMQE